MTLTQSQLDILGRMMDGNGHRLDSDDPNGEIYRDRDCLLAKRMIRGHHMLLTLFFITDLGRKTWEEHKCQSTPTT